MQAHFHFCFNYEVLIVWLYLYHITACTQGSIRLQGGSATRGRVEICNNNVWGTVCDDLWGTPDAQVACRQLGFERTSGRPLYLTAVPDGTGQIWLDNVQCTGSESRLIDCRANALGSHNCVHSEDAGVSCSQCKKLYIVCIHSALLSTRTVVVYSLVFMHCNSMVVSMHL